MFNSTTGHGEIWFDSDWGSTGARVQVASFDNITTLAGINEITDLDIVVYSNPQGDPPPPPPPASDELEGDPTIPPPPPEEPAGFLAGPAFASMAAASDEDQAPSLAANGITGMPASMASLDSNGEGMIDSDDQASGHEDANAMA